MMPAADFAHTRVVYLAHPLSDDMPTNLARARRWLRWAIEHYTDCAFVVPWLPYCDVLDDDNETHRKRGIHDDLAAMLRCDEVWLVGGVVSPGMALERDVAARDGLKVLDLTPFGPEPPKGRAS